MDQRWQIELFGWLRVVQGDRIVSRFRTRKAEALLAYLAYFRERSHPREQLIELLWPERERLAKAFLQMLHQLVGLLEEQGDISGALRWARRAVAADPLDEESHHRLIRLLLESGQIEAAREQFEQAEHRLLQELGTGL